MQKSTALFLSLCSIVTVTFFSCVPQKQVTTTKQQLTEVDAQLQQHSTDLKSLDQKHQTKKDKNEIDDTASNRLNKFIGQTNSEIDKLIAQNTLLIGTTSVNKDDWERLQAALTVSKSTSKLIGNKVALIDELINRTTVIKLEQDLIFGPGQYVLSPANANNINKVFAPATKEIDYFIKKYPDFPLSLVITARGYADATTISESSGLYRSLQERLKMSGRPPTAEDLNKELSSARAESVIKLLKTYSISKSADGTDIKVLHLFEGKGDKFPDPKLTDYKADDPRRRVVLLFWSLFPD